MAPRIVWATENLSVHNDNPYIYVSNNISTPTRKSPLLSWSSDVDIGHIEDLKTFFNESDQSSFYIITNGSIIIKIPIPLQPPSTQQGKFGANIKKHDKAPIFYQTAVSSFR